MSASLIPGVTDALLLVIASALPAATVVDGPLLNDPEIGQDYVSVGADPNGESGASGSQDWASLGRLSRDETFDVLGYIYTSTGDSDSTSVKTARDHAFAMLSAIEAGVRADPTLGGATSNAGNADVTSYDGRALQGPAGYAYGITFHITGRGRI